jgi:ABC-type Fe3+/spermidine/putrescine transport system ATPase subunit
MAFLRVSGIRKKTDEDFELHPISFTQAKFENVVVAGETGSGKSTILKIIAGLVQPDAGEVIFENEKVKGPDDTLVAGDPRIAYLSQHFELPKFLRVEQVLEYANTLPDKIATNVYKLCQIDHLLKRKTDQLSGGEKQRIALARLMISRPTLLLLDEPFSHLDMVHKKTLKTVIRNLSKKFKMSCILVSHDPSDTLSWADKIIVVRGGKLIQEGTPAEVYTIPVDEYVAGLFGRYNFIPANLAARWMKWIQANRRDIVVRPEHVRIVSKRPQSFKGKIVSNHFYGGYREVVVEVTPELNVAVRTDKILPEGKTVFLSVTPKKLIYV